MDALRDRRSPLRPLAVRLALALAAGVLTAPALALPSAMDAGVLHAGPRPSGWRLDPRPSGAVSVVAWGEEGARLRPRHALRVRFEGATRAMRGLGVEAQDCNALVRSSSRFAASRAGEAPQWQVSVALALDCRFF